jgi:hypothetical protein
MANAVNLHPSPNSERGHLTTQQVIVVLVAHCENLDPLILWKYNKSLSLRLLPNIVYSPCRIIPHPMSGVFMLFNFNHSYLSVRL